MFDQRRDGLRDGGVLPPGGRALRRQRAQGGAGGGEVSVLQPLVRRFVCIRCTVESVSAGSAVASAAAFSQPSFFGRASVVGAQTSSSARRLRRLPRAAITASDGSSAERSSADFGVRTVALRRGDVVARVVVAAFVTERRGARHQRDRGRRQRPARQQRIGGARRIKLRRQRHQAEGLDQRRRTRLTRHPGRIADDLQRADVPYPGVPVASASPTRPSRGPAAGRCRS